MFKRDNFYFLKMNDHSGLPCPGLWRNPNQALKSILMFPINTINLSRLWIFPPSCVSPQCAHAATATRLAVDTSSTLLQTLMVMLVLENGILPSIFNWGCEF